MADPRQRIGKMKAGIPATIYDKLPADMQYDVLKAHALHQVRPWLPATYYRAIVWLQAMKNRP